MNRRRLLDGCESGATAVEYGLIAGLIALGIVGSLVGTRGSLSTTFGTAATQMGSSTAVVPTFKLNSALPRAAYWSAKTLSGPVTVSQDQNSLGIYKTITAKFTDGSSFQMYFDINGKNYRATTVDPLLNSVTVVDTDTSGFPGNTLMRFLSSNPDGSSYTSKVYTGDNQQIYTADGYDKGYPLGQNTETYRSDGSTISTVKGPIGDDFKTAITNSEADAYLFRNSGY